MGLIAKCGHGDDFDHETEHVFNDLRPKSKKGYQDSINRESTDKFKTYDRVSKYKLRPKDSE